MVLAEVLIEKNILDEKIKEMRRYLFRMVSVSAEEADKATKRLIELIDKHRSYLILINKVNNNIEVTIGDSKISLANALLISQTMDRKIDLLNELINDCDGDTVLSIFSLIAQRDKLLDEYILISNQLEAIEWGAEVD